MFGQRDEVSIGLGLRSNLKRDLNVARGRLRRFATGVTSMFRGFGRVFFSMKSAVAFLAGGLVVRGLARVINSTAELNDSFAKLNDRLGISVETLQELKFAGEQSGVAWGTFSSSIERAVRRMEEFRATGKGVATDAIGLLGLKDAVKNGETLESLLPRIAAGFGRLSTEGRTRAAYGLFGREGISTTQLFGGGAKALSGLRGQARRLGFVQDRETLDQSTAYLDAMGRLKATLGGLLNQAVTPLIPELETLAETLKDLAVDKGPSVIRMFQKMANVLNILSGGTPLDGKVREISQGVAGGFIEAIIGTRMAANARASAGRGPNVQGQFNMGGQGKAPGMLGGLPGVDTGIIVSSAQPGYFDRLRGEMEGYWSRYEELATSAAVHTEMTLGTALYSMENTVGGLAVGALTWKEAMRAATDSIVSDLARIAFRMAAIRAISSIGGLFAPTPAPVSLPQPMYIQRMMPKAASGAVLEGPASGYPVMLHGKEKVRVEPLGGRSGEGRIIHIHNYYIQATDADTFDRKWLGSFSRNAELVAYSTAGKMSGAPRLAGRVA